MILGSDIKCVSAFLGQKSPEEREVLFSFLSAEDAAKIQDLKKPCTKNLQLDQLLKRVHPSWIAPFLETYCEEDQRLFLSVLGENQQSHIADVLGIEGPFPPLSQCAETFVQKTLTEWLFPEKEQLEPLQCLEEHPLFFLFEISYPHLKRMIFFLGLHDLAFDVKTVIETRILRAIERILSSSEKNRLSELMSQGEKVQFAHLNLTGWDGDEALFREVIASRGINRLGKALSGISPSFMWIVMRLWDQSESFMLKKLCIDPKNPEVKAVLIDQVIEAKQLSEEANP